MRFAPRSLTRGREKFGPSAVSAPEVPDFRPAPPGGSADRPALGAGTDRAAQPELLGRAIPVAVSAEAADVAVVIAAILGERKDVVGNCGLANNAPGGAVPAERFGP